MGRLTKAEIVADLMRLDIPHAKSWRWNRLNAALRKDKARREAAVNASASA